MTQRYKYSTTHTKQMVALKKAFADQLKTDKTSSKKQLKSSNEKFVNNVEIKF